jgi:ribosomal protein L32
LRMLAWDRLFVSRLCCKNAGIRIEIGLNSSITCFLAERNSGNCQETHNYESLHRVTASRGTYGTKESIWSAQRAHNDFDLPLLRLTPTAEFQALPVVHSGLLEWLDGRTRIRPAFEVCSNATIAHTISPRYMYRARPDL